MNAKSEESDAHLATLRQTPLLFSSVAEQLREEHLRFRPLPNEWSLVELLAHLHACAEIWGDDIERMLAFDTPRFTKPHPRQAMQSGRYRLPPFAESAHTFADLRERLMARLQSLGPDQWERGATINGRSHTVYTHTRRMAQHEAAHADQIRQACRVIVGLKPRPTSAGHDMS